MADRLTAEKRSWNMSRIRGKDTSIEVQVRKSLFSKGFRFRKNDKRLPGKPDIVLPKYRTVIFVHGCFWHRHPGCKYATTPSSNTVFWENKFLKNTENDKKWNDELTANGWRVLVVWECEIRQHFEETIQNLARQITNNYPVILSQDNEDKDN